MNAGEDDYRPCKYPFAHYQCNKLYGRLKEAARRTSEVVVLVIYRLAILLKGAA